MRIAHLALMAALAAASGSAGATSIADGGFEAKGSALPVTDYCYDGFATPGGPACAAGAWVGGGVIKSGSGPWGGTTTPFGSYYGFVQGSSVVSQTFTATKTWPAVLSWADANRTNNGGLQSYQVTIEDGSSVFDLGSYTSHVGGFVAKTSDKFWLTSGVEYTLKFTGLYSDDRTSFIDNVVLTSVPEPGSWAMMFAGFGLMGIAMRRRRRVAAA